MILRAIQLARFRNIGDALVEPHPRFNVLSGENGQGKTNFLEAVYLLGTLRSFRAGRLDELVRFGDASARVSAQVERGEIGRRFDVEVWGQPARKQARIDGKLVRAAADYFGGFNVVLFVPDDLRLPRGAPSGRRRFLDRAVWNVDSGFLADAQAYDKALKSRNALLRDGRQGPDVLAVFDEQLATHGASVLARRRRYLSGFAPRFAEVFARIHRGGLAAEVRYDCPLPDDTRERTADAIRAALAASRPRDLAVGYTTSGPHSDDLTLLLDGRPARLHASQGQTRALVLALKIAEIEHLAAALGEPPILLLDDVASELDAERTAHLFGFLGDLSGQVFITATDARQVLVDGNRRDFRVRAGALGEGPAADCRAEEKTQLVSDN